MSNKIFLRTALIVLALALALTGCRRATPIAAPPADTAPSFAATVADQNYAVGAAIQRLTLPEASGGNGALRYTLGPEVPPGLSFDAAARTLTGTPELEGVYEMTYRVEDSDDNTSAADAATLAFTITVSPETAVATVVSAVRAGAADGVLRFASLPEPGTGPAVVPRWWETRSLQTVERSSWMSLPIPVSTSCWYRSTRNASATTRSTCRTAPGRRIAWSDT